jgi:O-antigen/teichoic acid export membrane protein
VSGRQVDPGRRSRSTVFGTFGAMLAAQAAGAVLGLLFWVLAARLAPAAEVGTAAAAISLQTLLGSLATLGAQTLLMAELPHVAPERRRELLHRGLLLAGLASLVIGLVVLGVHGLLGTTLSAALDTPAEGVVFVVGVVAAAAGLVVDGAAIGAGRSLVQVVRNVVASGLRFPLLALLLLSGEPRSLVLQLTWVVPLLVSVAVARQRLRLPVPSAASPATTRRADLASYLRPSLAHHGLSLTLAAGSQLLPVLGGLLLVPEDNAAFAIAWLLATFVFLPPYLLATALFAHGASSGVAALRASTGSTLPVALVASGLLCVGAWALGEPVLRLFGGDYPQESWALLSLVVPAGLWMVFKDHLVALWRAEGRQRFATRLAALALVLEIGAAAIGGALGGATGLCLGWLCGTALEALLAVPLLRRAFASVTWRSPASVVRDLVGGGAS